MPGTKSPTPAPGLASGAVHRQLREQILGGDLAPGDALPSERVLSDQFGVNRHAVREALKRLQQAGLVLISQGGATRVRDWRDSAGLEVLLDLVEQGTEPPSELIRSVLEMRASIGVDAARRCAQRADRDARTRIQQLAETVAAAIDRSAESPEAVEPFVSLWAQVVDGSDNLAYRLGLNSLNSALDAFPQLGEKLTPRDPHAIRDLGAAIAAKDGGAAGQAAARLLEPDIDLAG